MDMPVLYRETWTTSAAGYREAKDAKEVNWCRNELTQPHWDKMALFAAIAKWKTTWEV